MSVNLSVACSLWLWSLANQPRTFCGSIYMYVGEYSIAFIYCMYLLVPGSMKREIWVVLGQGPMHHLCQCWASKSLTATSTCSWALSIASVEDCRWLSDRTSSAPSTVDQSAFWERREKAASSTTPMEEACSVVPGSERLSLFQG